MNEPGSGAHARHTPRTLRGHRIMSVSTRCAAPSTYATGAPNRQTFVLTEFLRCLRSNLLFVCVFICVCGEWIILELVGRFPLVGWTACLTRHVLVSLFDRHNLHTNMALIAVVGATGLQGGAVARSLAASGKFTIRGITRKPDADPAKKLVSDIGCEIVKADLDDKASLVKAFEGCHGAFLITNFWEHLDTEKEIAQAKNLGDAAKEAGVKHCVFSSLEHCNKIWKTETKPIGKYLVPHFDGKGIAMEYFKEIGLPCTVLPNPLFTQVLQAASASH